MLFIYNGVVKANVNSRVEELIRDAEHLVGRAIEEVEVDLRDAAEKAWGATVRAVDALVLARTGRKPKAAHERRVELEAICLKDAEAERLRIADRYSTRSDYLHLMCFHEGVCEPVEAVKRRILETGELIEDVKKLIEAPLKSE